MSDSFGYPVFLKNVNTGGVDWMPDISADGLTLSFMRNPGPIEIWASTRRTTDDDFGAPIKLPHQVNMPGYDNGIPNLSADGSTLYFMSSRPGGFGGWDLWQVSITPIVNFNDDGRINYKDFSELALYWSADESSVDIAPLPLGDHRVDFKDVSVFSENWLLSMIQASNPYPADDAIGIDIDADLSWTPSDEAALHKVYFGSDLDNLPLVATQLVGQDSYDPPGDLIPGTTYYWWIDEVNDTGPPPGKWPGVMWSFTTIPGEAHTPSPTDDAVIPGVEYEYPPSSGNWYIWTKLIFSEGPTAVKHTGYFSEDYNDVANRAQDANLGPPPYGSTPGFETTYFAGNPMVSPANDTLVRGMTYFWCVDETDADGHTFSGDIWSFTTMMSPPPPP
jgi:hypothetical protein